MKRNFHSLSEKELFSYLKSSKKGISDKEATHRLEKYGKNILPEKKKLNPILIFLKQFHSALVYILIIAAVISFFVGHMIDVYVIAAVILANASIGFFQEFRAEKSIQALKKMVVSYSKVYRNGELLQIPSANLVPGDIILLEEGDKIGADARLLEVKNFRVVESSLTGESFPVDKFVKVLPEKIALADRVNMVFMGTFVASGSCKAIVVGTGASTEIGKIATEIKEIKRTKSHFKHKSDILARQMAFIAFLGALVTFFIGYFLRELEFAEIFLFTIASLVSGIPEGLPAVLAIVLAIGAYRMSRRNAIIRNLPATETLGIVNTIITDKTGTLTENTMNVEKILMPGYNGISVSGNGWVPKGNFFQDKKKINPLDNMQLSKLLKISAICNNARVFIKKNHKEKYQVIGDPTEAALVVLAEKAGLKKQQFKNSKLDDLPFNPELKYRASLSSLVRDKNKKEIFVIGAPEAVFLKSKYFLKSNSKKIFSNKDKSEFLSKIEVLTRNSMRVIALAYKPVSPKMSSLSEKNVNDLIFVGVVGIRDPPRSEVSESIIKAKNAGIRVVMVTGDHKGTALSIAKEIKLISSDEEKVYTGQELEELSEAEFRKVVKQTNVFARLTPKMKLRIATELQRQGQIIAMTGDGINDAPALKKADIGVSMGIIGTDVARESSEIVLADDNFSSIVNAIEEGRIVFINTQQAAGFLVSTNIAEDITIIAALLTGMPLILLPTQILWLNLVTDGINDIALASEPGHGDALSKKPRNSKQNFLSRDILPFILLVSSVMVLSTLFIFHNYLPGGIEKARTGAFLVMSFTQIFNVLNMRSLERSFFKLNFFANKVLVYSLLISLIGTFLVVYVGFFQNIFGFTTIAVVDLLKIILLSSLVFVFGEGYKFVKGKYKN